MEGKNIGKLSLTVEPDALREIISSGRLLEFANAAAAEAAAQIHVQLVQHVAEAALKPDGLKDRAISVEASYRQVLIDGEPGFGTHPPVRPPHFKV